MSEHRNMMQEKSYSDVSWATLMGYCETDNKIRGNWERVGVMTENRTAEKKVVHIILRP